MHLPIASRSTLSQLALHDLGHPASQPDTRPMGSRSDRLPRSICTAGRQHATQRAPSLNDRHLPLHRRRVHVTLEVVGTGLVDGEFDSIRLTIALNRGLDVITIL